MRPRGGSRASPLACTGSTGCPAAQLPALVSGHDVGLGIFGTTTKALTVVPTKAYQAAAAGCVMLTSDTVPQRDSFGDAAMYVPPGDPHALAEALRRAGRSTRRP